MNLGELGRTSLVQHDIKLDDVTPFKEQYHRILPHQYEEVKKHLTRNVGDRSHTNGLLVPGLVLWYWFVRKDGSLRFCIDLRKLNNRTIKDAQSLPSIEDSLDCLDGATIFTSLDLQLASGTDRG